MLVFSTRFPLVDSVTKEDCLSVFIDWIINSPHYNIDCIEYDVASFEDLEIDNGDTKIHFKHYSDEKTELHACRFENHESNIVWFNDCVFLCENGHKSLLVQLHCNVKGFKSSVPTIHKPYVVRKFIEKGYCSADVGIPVTDVPLKVEEGYLDICASIMRGESLNTMPVVYISCDYNEKTDATPTYLAHQLSGIAHVFVETKSDTSLKMKDKTNSKNVYGGYVGIYFPRTPYCRKHSLSFYSNSYELNDKIIDSVWQALTSRLEASEYNWNQILTLQAKQKMKEWQDISESTRNELDAYMNTFDGETTELRDQINELNKQLYALQSKCDAYEVRINANDKNSCFYRTGAEESLYDSEYNDLLFSILSQVQCRFEENSRAYTLIQSLLTANPRVGKCSEIVACIREVFGTDGVLTSEGKRSLKEVGFIIKEDGPHYKIIFRDPRYTFSVAKTPSEGRQGKNTASDICKVINVEHKIY